MVCVSESIQSITQMAVKTLKSLRAISVIHFAIENVSNFQPKSFL